MQGCIFTKTNADGLSTAGTTSPANTVNETPINRATSATTGDLVAHSALNFAHNIAVLLNEDMHYGKTTIFSPISIMSSMVMLLLGSKGKSYEDLRHIFRLDVPQLSDALTNAFHLEFGAMLQEMQDNAITLQSRNRDNWRNTNVAYSIRNKPIISAENAIKMSNVIKIVNGLFIKSGYELNASYR